LGVALPNLIAQTGCLIYLWKFVMATLDQPRRSWLFAYVLAAAVIAIQLSLLSAAACAQAATAAAAPPQAKPESDDDGISIRIPPQPECLAKMGDWTEPEKWAWQQICAREKIDFDKLHNKESSGDNLDSLKSDPARLLGASFFRSLFENPQLAVFTQNAAIDITGAYIPTIQLADTTVGSLRIAYSKIDGDILFESVTILRSFRIGNSSISRVDLRRSKGGDINIFQSSLDVFYGMLLNVGRLSVLNSKIDSFELLISRLSQQLSVATGSFNSIHLDDIKSDGLFIRPSSATSVRINNYVDGGMFYLDVRHWTGESELKISTMATGHFFLREATVPATVSISGFSFSGANWGSDPLPFLQANKPYNPALYAHLAASYADAGQPDTANDILIDKQNAEYKNATSLMDKAYLYMIWLLADYGYRPELGLLWITGFVLVSALIFKSGESQIRQGNPPDNWLIFAFDSAIPGIQLNKEHADIQFRGWRQAFLYLLRFLGAVVVVLVLELMKKSLSGL
jgi:hypothetical protein